MPAKLVILNSAVLACAVAVEGVSLASLSGRNATLVARACDYHDATRPVCQTSGGSPLGSDCVEALNRLATRCNQSNNAYITSTGTDCKTQAKYGTCKIDVCGQYKAQIADGVVCGGYLQSILNDCLRDGRVGGYIVPEKCNVHFKGNAPEHNVYRLQFSHS